MPSIIQDFLASDSFLRKRYHSIFRKKCSKSQIFGYAIVLVASILAGMADVIPKPMLGDSSGREDSLFLNPIIFVFMIYIINSLFFTGITKKPSLSSTKLKRKTILLLALIGIAEAAGTITYYIGLRETTAISASILGNGETVFAVLIAMMIFREKLQKKEILPFVLIIIGATIVPIVSDLGSSETMISSNLIIGNMLVLLSGIFYALDVTISKFVCQKVDSKRIMQVASISAAVFTLIVIVTLEIPFEIDFLQLPIIIITGIFGMGLSSIFFIIALKIIGAVRAVLIYSTTTIFGIVFAALYLYESVTLTSIASVFIVIVGIYLLRTKLS